MLRFYKDNKWVNKNFSLDARIRRASKTPPTTPVDELGKGN